MIYIPKDIQGWADKLRQVSSGWQYMYSWSQEFCPYSEFDGLLFSLPRYTLFFIAIVPLK